MKKLKLITLFILLILPITVKAENSLSIECASNKVKPGDTVSCNITGHADNEIGSLEATVTYGNGLSRDSFSTSSKWVGDDGNNKIEVEWRDEGNDITGDFSLGTLKVKVSDDASEGNTTLELKNIVFYHLNDEINVSNASTTLTVEITSEPVETGLKNITVTGGVLSPTFSKDEHGYTLNLASADTTAFSLNIVKASDNATLSIIDEDTKNPLDASNIVFTTTGGKKVMSITISVSDETEPYTILVTRPNPVEIGAAELSSLVIGGKNVTLASGKYDYEITLSDVNEYDIRATLKDSNNYEFDSSTTGILSPYTLSGEKEFTIIINPKDNTSGLSSATYIIKVKKPSDNSGGGNNSSNQPVPGNPQTGGSSMAIMMIVLVLSFSASIYLYKRNMGEYN